MSIRLLDVNLLIALLDSAHVHHRIAVSWFRSAAAVDGWATSPVAESGFIRIVSNINYPNLKLTQAMAADSLGRFKAGFPGLHQFWAEEISLTDTSVFDLSVLTNPRQITDTYLAGLAFFKRGRLATLDSGIIWRAVRGANAGLVDRIVPHS